MPHRRLSLGCYGVKFYTWLPVVVGNSQRRSTRLRVDLDPKAKCLIELGLFMILRNIAGRHKNWDFVRLPRSRKLSHEFGSR